jgi:hypothetical protein
MNKEKTPFQSKKFIAMFVGVCFTTVFTITGLVFIAIVPTASTDVVNLMTVALATVNGLVTLYAIGQSAVDWKINSSTESKTTVVKQDNNT